MADLLLEASGVGFRYGRGGAGVEALRDVSVTLSAGEVVALIGPNGSGKSTLIKTLVGALRPVAGDVRWDGRAARQWSRRGLARHVAYLAQTPLYEPGQTVLEALRLGRAPYWSLFGIESPRD